MSDSNRKEVFSARIRQLLIDRQWSQSEAARHCGLGRDVMSIYALGKSLPGPKHLAKLAKGFGVEPNDILPPREKAAEGLSVTEMEDGSYTVTMTRRLSAKGLRRLLEVIEEETVPELTEAPKP